MTLHIHARLDYGFDRPTDVLVQVEAAMLGEQRIEQATLSLPPGCAIRRVAAHGGVGERILTTVAERLTIDYRATVTVTRPVRRLESRRAIPVHALPGETIAFLMPSRYCPSDAFELFAKDAFGGIPADLRAAAIADHVRATITYEAGASHGGTTAADTIAAGRGVCRDFAHVTVTLARAAGIPARVASGYAPGVTPPDFHLVAQLYLEDGWHIVDATGMTAGDDLAVIGIGRDAADVAFLNSWGDARFLSQSVVVERG